jgi:phosphate/sulfate permease
MFEMVLIFLFVLAIVDLYVGVSNDAVNFLNSAVGSKAGSLRLIFAVAAIGIICGAVLSNGMMDIARHGIFRPQLFVFSEMMCMLLAVMLTDVVILDVFNSLGLPTSTTVSMVFELLGASVAMAWVKSAASNGTIQFASMFNTDKALQVILAIFFSVAVAFFFGIVVQWITRLLLTFDYNRRMKWWAGILGGIAITSIVYFMLIKGLADASFMTADKKMWVTAHTGKLVLYCFLGSAVLMQLLYFLKVNVLKVIVLTGTFALAMAFAGNDLVNFIGVPLAGYSAYQDFAANGASVGPDAFTMDSLNGPAGTPILFLIAAGLIMVVSLITSKKAKNVIKTSLDLSRQEEGNEMFGSSPLARVLVHASSSVAAALVKITPVPVRRWIDSRFDDSKSIMPKGASFDLVRASVNLVLAGLLIALGTSFKLPLSTTYVTFMVAMGSSLADRAWGRESAVFRITGVVAVIGGWFVTAAVAFIVCFLVTLAMHFGGNVVTLILCAVAIYMLISSQIRFKEKNTESDDGIYDSMSRASSPEEVWRLLRAHNKGTAASVIEFVSDTFASLTGGFAAEDRRAVSEALNKVREEKDNAKKMKKRELIGMMKLDQNTSVQCNTWFHQASNNLEQMIYCLQRMGEPFKEHLDNNFNPLPEECRKEFSEVRDELANELDWAGKMVAVGDYDRLSSLVAGIDGLRVKLGRMMEVQMNRIHASSNGSNLNIYMVYMNELQESQQLAASLKHLMLAEEKFQC